MGNPFEQKRDTQAEQQERGANVYIDLHFIRHGERDPQTNELVDYGRQVTRDNAAQFDGESFDTITPVGSEAAGSEGGMRSLETARIHGRTIAGTQLRAEEQKEQVKPGMAKEPALILPKKEIIESRLNYETLVTPPPYNHTEVYNSNLPANFKDLDDEGKAAASAVAQKATLEHLFSLQSDQATTFKKEAAGAFAQIVLEQMAAALNSKSKTNLLMPAGTHGGTMEHLLQQALVFEDQEGNTRIGFDSLEDIGGPFYPSESYDVHIMTDDKGEFKKLVVTFADPNRPQGKMYLDEAKLKELAQLYQELHAE